MGKPQTEMKERNHYKSSLNIIKHTPFDPWISYSQRRTNFILNVNSVELDIKFEFWKYQIEKLI